MARRTTIRDLPWICVVFGVCLLLIPLQEDSRIVPRDSLTTIEGKVASVSRYSTGGRSSITYLAIVLQLDSGATQLLRQRYSVVDFAPRILQLQQGDHVAVLAQDGGGSCRCLIPWDIATDAAPYLSYDDTSRYYVHRQHLAWGAYAGGLILLLAAVMLRVRMGSWKEPS
jgi:hypothetical protein